MTELNLIGRTIGRFDVLEELGRGGMAVVYKARQKSPNRIVALKVLPPELTFNKDYIARFHQEADSVAALEHPHIVPIYAVDQDQGLHYIAMKFIEGHTLKDLAQMEGAFSVERAIQLVGQIAEALDYAHSQNVIHRDIKPSNMMVTNNGWVYLTDFGLARGTVANAGLTATGTVMGTPEYMSPEQAQGSPNIGPATDIYALGVVLYELLTGRFPFEADTPMGMLAARLMQPPRPPREYRGELPLAVEDVIMRALARRPEARYKTAGDLINDLRQAIGASEHRQPQRPTTPSDGLTIPAMPTPTPLPQQVAYRPQPTPQPIQQPTPWPQQPQQPTPWPQQPQQPQTSWPQQPPAPPAPPTRSGGVGMGILIGVGATILMIILACVGLGVWANSLPDSPTTSPTPQVSQRETPATQPTPQNAAPTAGPALEPALAQQIEAGDAALVEADFSTADASYQEAIAQQPDSAEALTRLALLNDFKARYSEVVVQSQQAIDAAQGNSEQEALAHALLADGLLVGSKFQEAVDAATKATELDSTLGLAHAVQANTIARLAAERFESDKADSVRPLIETAESEMEDDPTVLQALTHSLIGDAYMSLHDLSGDESDLEAAKDAYNEALDVSEQPLFHSGLGFANSRSAEYAKARTAFNAALALDPSFAHAHLGLGWTDFYDPEIKNYDPALEGFTKALELTPEDPWTLYARGRVFFEQEKYVEASEDFRNAAASLPDSLVTAWLGRAIQRQGFISATDEEAQRFYAEAAEIFQQALEQNDRQIVALTHLGWTQQYQEKYEESVESFTKSIAITDEQNEAYNGIGWSFYNLGKYDDAEIAFRRAIELDSRYANAFYGLGQTLEQLGKIDDAKQAYRDALAINAEYTDAQNALDKLPQ